MSASAWATGTRDIHSSPEDAPERHARARRFSTTMCACAPEWAVSGEAPAGSTGGRAVATCCCACTCYMCMYNMLLYMCMYVTCCTCTCCCCACACACCRLGASWGAARKCSPLRRMRAPARLCPCGRASCAGAMGPAAGGLHRFEGASHCGQCPKQLSH